MRFKLIMVYVTLMALCVSLSACKKMAESEEAESSAATVEHLNGDGPARVTLTEDAAKRLDVQTAPIQESEVNGAKQKAMPYSALLYDTKGDTWAFTNPEGLTYIREPVGVARIDGDTAVLAVGPAAGTKVVTVGAAELYGSEVEFEEE
jgi:hypothetical protein